MNADCPVSMKSTNWSAGETPTGQLLPPKMVQVLVKVLLLGVSFIFHAGGELFS